MESMITHEESNVKIDSVHIATSLIALKFRHHLSNNCITDILALLNLLGINIPSNYKSLCTLLRKHSNKQSTPSKYTICPHCKKVSYEICKCTVCGANYSPISQSSIGLFYTYDIHQQLKSIMASSPDLVLQDNKGIGNQRMSDITDGNMYTRLATNEPCLFITLTLNVDGIQPNKGSDQSIWPVLLVINEIKRKKRYSLENLIIAGMWPGPTKPSRTEMFLFFQNIISQLQELERGQLYELYSTEHGCRREFLKVYVIAACCDKPAQCLIQCLPEPTGYFGCGQCEIKGEFN